VINLKFQIKCSGNTMYYTLLKHTHIANINILVYLSISQDFFHMKVLVLGGYPNRSSAVLTRKRVNASWRWH